MHSIAAQIENDYFTLTHSGWMSPNELTMLHTQRLVIGALSIPDFFFIYVH